jgi:hypothetical protein
MYIDMYEGEHLMRYLRKHIRESQKSVDARSSRLYYLNYCQPVVDLYTHYIFSKPIVRKENAQEILTTQAWEGDVADYEVLAGSPGEMGGVSLQNESSEWRKWLRDVDRNKSSIDRYMADASRYALIFGHVYILVDMPELRGVEIRSEQDRLDQNLRPYLTTYFPNEASDWAVDGDGKLVWIRFKEPLDEKFEPFKPRDPKEKGDNGGGYKLTGLSTRMQGKVPDGKYITWTREGWIRHKVEEGKLTVEGQGVHPIGEVPVAVLYNKKYSQYAFFGTSLLSDIARLNVGILNWASLLDEEIYQKTLNILAVQRQREDRSEIVIGPDNVLEWDGATAPFFLAPSTDPGAFIASQIDRAREEIYRLAKLGGGLGLTTPQRTPSGTAQAFEFNETNRTLAERADEIQLAENTVHRYWHTWLGLEWEGTVDYPEDFSVESFADELDIAMKAKQQVRSPTFKREVERTLARKMLNNVSPAMLTLIGLEIDVMPELVMGPFGPMYFTPGEQPSSTPTTADEISRSPFDQSQEDEETPPPSPEQEQEQAQADQEEKEIKSEADQEIKQSRRRRKKERRKSKEKEADTKEAPK